MTRDVTCTVYNYTGQNFYVDSNQTDVWNGKEKLNPQTISSGSDSQELFSYEKTTGSMVGVTGKVFYQFGNNTFLQISFNNPYSQVVMDSEYAYCLCFFYAGITNVTQENVPGYKIVCAVETNGQPWNPTNTSEVTQLSATIYIYNND